MAKDQRDDFYMTVEEFAKWLLSHEQYLDKKIWKIDITLPYKGKALFVDESPSKEYISVEDARDSEG